MSKASAYMRLLHVALIVVVTACTAGELPHAMPEDVGMSASRLDYIDKFYENKVRRGEMAGIVTLIARHGKVVHFSAIGYADVERKSRMDTNTIFRIYSMTKPITSVALMILYERRRFRMNDPVAKYIPEFAGLRVLRTPSSPIEDTVPLERPVTIEDLMRHTAGFTAGDDKDSAVRYRVRQGKYFRRRPLSGTNDAKTRQDTLGLSARIRFYLQHWTRCAGTIGGSTVRHVI
jgi:CubicO group peptidase (beta-lactamase class C family)